ncbi:hypothetical protein MK489_24310 [Myxococcota bacterium]|nr:hypothetical protein [Myxococcota bacterium]
MNCRILQRRLENDLGSPSPEVFEHLAGCPDCTAHRALLKNLRAEAQAAESPPLSRELLARVENRALAALHTTELRRPFRRELWVPLAVALFALPIAMAQGWLWLQGLFLVLEAWLPIPILTGISIFYIASLGLTLGALYALLPFAVSYANRVETEVP